MKLRLLKTYRESIEYIRKLSENQKNCGAYAVSCLLTFDLILARRLPAPQDYKCLFVWMSLLHSFRLTEGFKEFQSRRTRRWRRKNVLTIRQQLQFSFSRQAISSSLYILYSWQFSDNKSSQTSIPMLVSTAHKELTNEYSLALALHIEYFWI